MLRAVTFDFWNTLFVDTRGREREQRRAALLREALAAAGRERSEQAVAEALRAGWAFFDRVWVGEARTPLCRETVEAILATLGVTLPEERLTALVRGFEELILDLPPEPTPDAPAVVRELAGRYRLAVVCDTGYSPGRVLRRILAGHDLLDCFGYLFFSDEHGMSKPDPRVFRHTLAQLGVRPGEAAHVGDIQRTDIAGAQAAGMSAVHFIGANDSDAAHSTADVVVSHFEDLPRALGGFTCAGC